MKSLLTVLSVLLISTVAIAQDGVKEFEEAEKYKKEGDIPKWFDAITRSAGFGNMMGYSGLGDAYYAGIGVESDLAKSLEYYVKAADMGHALSAYWAGDMYRLGEGSAADKAKALTYYKKATELGNPDAVRKVLDLSATETEAMEFLKTTVAKGNYESARVIGEMYIIGEGGITQNFDEAMVWLKKGEAANHAGCLYVMAYIYRNGKSVPQDGTVELTAEGKDLTKAVDYYYKAATLGNIDAMHNLGEMYYQNIEIEANYETSFKWFEYACSYNSGYACYMCSYLIVKSAVSRTQEEAGKFAAKSLELGYMPE